MKYLEFIQNEETQLVEMIRFKKGAAERFFIKMGVAANYDKCVELMSSLYAEVFYAAVELTEGELLMMAEINGRSYEIHNHLFTAYLVSLVYNTQYWEILLDVIATLRNYPDGGFSVTFRNLYEKLTKEPIENFVKEVQIVNPGYEL